MGESVVLSVVNLITFTQRRGPKRLCFLEVYVYKETTWLIKMKIFFKNVPQITIDYILLALVQHILDQNLLFRVQNDVELKTTLGCWPKQTLIKQSSRKLKY